VHFKRWITGLIALPFLIFAVYSGGIAFFLLVGFAGMCSLWEYFRIVFNADRQILSNFIVRWGFGVSLAMLGAAYIADLSSVVVLVASNLVVIGLISVFQYKSVPAVIEIVSRQIQGIVYIPLLLSFLILMRRDFDGMTWIFLLLGIIFAGDISAYYVGSYLGRHKLAPSISPGKTVEGAIGGLAGNLLVGSIGKIFFLPDLAWGFSICFILATGIAGQVGDLFESELKRSSKIKDSGGILPGHGGFLDRIDALLFASPVAYFFKVYIF
jgi:phosphatidate cytidylyltransferase